MNSVDTLLFVYSAFSFTQRYLLQLPGPAKNQPVALCTYVGMAKGEHIQPLISGKFHHEVLIM